MSTPRHRALIPPTVEHRDTFRDTVSGREGSFEETAKKESERYHVALVRLLFLGGRRRSFLTTRNFRARYATRFGNTDFPAIYLPFT